MLTGKKLAFIGGGNMGQALIGGLLNTGIVKPEQITVTDIDRERLNMLGREHGVSTTQDNCIAASQADIILLAVKPQAMGLVLEDISPGVDGSKLILSIVAGVTISYIKSLLTDESRIVRIMPNTPALIREGAAALAAGKNATDEDISLAVEIFSSVGKALVVEEKLMDAVTGLSGSGPAYVFIFIEALTDGAVRMGLPRDVAVQLAAQTVVGAARMIHGMGKHPGELKDMVTSPGGTTIAGINALEQGAFRAAVMNAVEAATLRSQELGDA